MTEDARPPDAGQWMPTKPMGTITALMSAAAVTVLAAIVVVQFSWSPLQRYYLSTYAKTTIGEAIGMRDKPYAQILMTAKNEPGRSYFAGASDVEFIDDADGQRQAVLTQTAQQDGMTRVFGHESRMPQTRMRALLARHIYAEQGLLRLARGPLVTGGLALALLLVWGIPLDLRRARERRRGTRLRGAEMVSMATFNERVAGRS